MTPIRAPDKIRRKRIRSGSSQAGVRLSWISPSFPVLHLCSDNLRIIRKRPRNKAPRIPLEKASSPEERGIYLLKRPIVPKISMDDASISSAPGRLVSAFILPNTSHTFPAYISVYPCQ